MRDFKVKIKDDVCDVIDVHDDRLFCHLDNAIHFTEDNLPKAVKVSVGDLDPVTVFYLWYPRTPPNQEAQSTSAGSDIEPLLIGVAALFLVLIVSIVAFVVLLRRRRRHKREKCVEY